MRPGPYQHLAEEFERRLAALHEAGVVPDLRVAQIERLKTTVADLKERISRRDRTIAELEDFKALAVSRLLAQHEEILRLRQQSTDAAAGKVRMLPSSASREAPFGSCS